MKSLLRFHSLVNRECNSIISIINRSFSNMVKSKKFIYAKRFDGEPKISDFELIEEELPALQDGGKFVYVFGPLSIEMLRIFLSQNILPKLCITALIRICVHICQDFQLV